MAVDNNSLRDPQRISSLAELEAAKKKAAINASQDRQLLSSNLDRLKEGGPAVILQNVVLPVAAVGAGIWATSKIVGSIFSGGKTESGNQHFASHAAPTPHAGATSYAPPPAYAPQPRNRNTIKEVAKYLPVAIKLAKMGVSYLEKNGTTVPTIVHTLLSGPGNPPQRATTYTSPHANPHV